MTDRRAFLKAAGAILGVHDAPSGGTLAQARTLVRGGELGRIAFCRVPHEDLRPAARYILSDDDCIIGIEPTVQGVTLLGSRATLAISETGCRLFANPSAHSRSRT